MNLNRAQRELEARTLQRDIEEFNEDVIEQGFKDIDTMLEGELDAKIIEENEKRVRELHRLPYFYVIAKVGGTREERVFTIDNLVSVALLFKASMPEKYKQLAINHFLRAEFVQKHFEPNENIGVFNIYHGNKIISWLVCVFYLATVYSFGHDFFSFDYGVMGMEVHMPYGSDVCLYKVKRGSENAYVVGFPGSLDFVKKFGYLSEELPMEAMDMHDTLALINTYNCPKCKEGVCSKPSRHIQSFPIVCVNKDRIETVRIDLAESARKGQLRGELKLLNQWVG